MANGLFPLNYLPLPLSFSLLSDRKLRDMAQIH
jgi:hypothetical protein